MLRKIRIVAATICFTLITLLFLDFTGTLHLWFGWLAKIQFLPAVLALNVGVVAFLVILTLLFGRVYCSVICPLGVFQDIVSWISGKRKKNQFRYSPAISWLRYSMLALFIVALLAGFTAIAALIAPYSAYGRIASNLFAPLYQWGNNLLAYFAERIDSYAFYSTDVWLKSIPTFIIALVTFVSLIILAWKTDAPIATRFARWVLFWGYCPDSLFSAPLSTRQNVTVANRVPATAKPRASMPKTTSSITAVAWLAWIVSKSAGRELYDTFPEERLFRNLSNQHMKTKRKIPDESSSRSPDCWPVLPY